MNRFALAQRSALHFWKAHTLTLITAALGAAILIGALLVGDSVRYSLRAMALERLGKVNHALIGGDRFFKADLEKRLTVDADTSPSALIVIQGIAISDATQKRASQIFILGVEETFWNFGQHNLLSAPKKGEVVLNAPLAEKIGAKVGDDVRLRIYKPSQLSHDAPLGSDEDNAVLLRAKVSAIIQPRGLGRFGFDANQVAPMNAYLPIADVQEKIEQKGRANILLFGTRSTPNLEAAWSLEDAQMKLRVEEKLGFAEVTTSRVFLDDVVCEKLLKADPKAYAVTTYFVNGLRANGKETPYSMVAAAPPPLSEGMKPDEILINTWTAEDLGAKAGDTLELEYFTVGLRRKLETNKRTFKIKGIVPIENLYGDRGLMPDFPGIAEVDTTHDWDSSIPIEMGKIRDKDDEYWKKYKGTPKAFITLEPGVEMWKNRFGSYTAVRFPLLAGKDVASETARVTQLIKSSIKPEDAGLAITPVRELALKASSQALDFGGLFIGFSFFLITAALLLMSLVFRFSIESRASEAGLMLAIGFTPQAVRRTLWWEGTFLAALGSALGAIGATVYARAMIENLGSRWKDAIGTSALEYHAEPLTIVIGVAIALVVSSFTIWLSVRGLSKHSARDLLTSTAQAMPGSGGLSRVRWIAMGAVGLVGAVALAGYAASLGAKGAVATLYFGAGGMLLLAAMAALRWLFADRPAAEPATQLTALGVRAVSRRSSRSTVTALLLASGTFLVLAVGANRLDATLDAEEKTSGTGGFALLARTTIPVFEDLNTTEGRSNAGINEGPLKDVTIYPFRVRAGDEASCLNLNRAQRPRILGVPRSFVERGGFTFAADMASGMTTPWLMLGMKREDGAVYAIGDYQSLTWALGLKVGDTLSVPDEKEAPQMLMISGAVSNSVLQGSLLIAEDDFLRLFPTENGYKEFFIDAPSGKVKEVAEFLEKSLADEGLTSIPAAQRLAEFNAVQNTYLSTFQALGGLGMLLGSFGLGLVVLRNVLERRGELALLQALGFSRGAIRWLVLSEHVWLLTAGLLAGVLPALLAIVPASKATTLPVPWAQLGLTALGIFACGAFASLLAVYVSLRANLLDALRDE